MDTYSLWIFTIGDIMGLSPQSGGPRLVTEGLTTIPAKESMMARDKSTPFNEEPTSVYRYYDKRGLLLYVGITRRGTARNSEHNASKSWWQHVVRQEVSHYSTRRAAHNMEKELIRQYRPPFNVQHNPGHEEVREAYLAFLSVANGATDAAELIKAATPAGESPRRIALAVAGHTGNMLILTSTAADAHKVKPLDEVKPVIDGCNIYSGGRRGTKVTGWATRNGILTLQMRVRDAGLCSGGEAVIRLPGPHAPRAAIKMITLDMPKVA